jgi:hypothetical protein
LEEEKIKKTELLEQLKDARNQIVTKDVIKNAYKHIESKINEFDTDKDKIVFGKLKMTKKNFKFLVDGLEEEFDECNILERLQNYEDDE